VVNVIPMHADCRGAKALVLCVARVKTHAQDKIGVCACNNICAQAVESVKFLLLDFDVCVQRMRVYAVICLYEPNRFYSAYSFVTLRCIWA
jgi:hypothetical protein